MLYQTSRQALLDSGMTASGTDHSNAFEDAVLSFACNDFEIIDYFFPKDLPLSKGHYYSDAVNLLMILYYKQDHLLDEALKRADKLFIKNLIIKSKYWQNVQFQLLLRRFGESSVTV